MFRDLGKKFSKTNIIFKISTLEIGYIQNFTKIRNLILFGPICPNLDVWTQKFQKPMSHLKPAPSK